MTCAEQVDNVELPKHYRILVIALPRSGKIITSPMVNSLPRSGKIITSPMVNSLPHSGNPITTQR